MVGEVVAQPPLASAVAPSIGDEASQRARVGERLRQLRRLRRLTLDQVAAAVGLSASFLSMLERGQADISLSRFSRVASFYGIRPSELLLEREATAEPSIVEQDGLLIDRGPGVTYRLLNPSDRSAHVVHTTIAPGCAFRDLLAHRGHDFWWVLQGNIVLLYGDGEFRVAQGQLVSYEATQPHAIRNDSDRAAELLGFSTPPYW